MLKLVLQSHKELLKKKNDKQTLIPIIDDVISNLGKTPRYILIDNGTLNHWNMPI